jgi:phytoene/squalene synthetase
MEKDFASRDKLAEAITWAASKQTYYTIHCLVDRGRRREAYRAYAYFRWVDDRLDGQEADRTTRSAFVERQKTLAESLYRGQTPGDLTREEYLLADLVATDREPNSGLQTYLRNMLAVMLFDTERRGRLISHKELNEYTRWLATAVTEAMHYFIGHCCAAPQNESRYLAVTAAHIVHMLRDAHEDTAAGYINIPREYLEAQAISAADIDSAPYRLWVKGRVQLARDYFQIGARYLAQVQNPRCRLAGYAYTARFTRFLDAIEKDGYRLQPDYAEFKHPASALKMGWSVLGLALNGLRPEIAQRTRSEA